jgi:peptidoglycan/xylan/chitin deacetylase (PgdA/CDA1 family)
MAFGSHGHYHMAMSRLPLATAESQLKLSREVLEQNLGCAIREFSLPYGFISRALVQAAEQAGFEAICTSQNWPFRAEHKLMGRLAVYGSTGIKEFQALLAGDPVRLLLRRTRELALCMPKQLMLRFCPQFLGVRGVQVSDEESAD